jgi:hypothetical protein
MEQMSLDGLEIVPVNYENEQLPRPVRDFRPAVWKDGDGYCCLLGPGPEQGIFGCGATPDQAMQDWTTNFRRRLAEAGEDDPVVTEIKDYKSMSKDDVW